MIGIPSDAASMFSSRAEMTHALASSYIETLMVAEQGTAQQMVEILDIELKLVSQNVIQQRTNDENDGNSGVETSDESAMRSQLLLA